MAVLVNEHTLHDALPVVTGPGTIASGGDNAFFKDVEGLAGRSTANSQTEPPLFLYFERG